MSTDHDHNNDDPGVDARTRAQPDVSEWEPSTRHLQVLAALAEGAYRLEDIDEDLFFRCVEAHGLERVLDAAREGAARIAAEESEPSTAPAVGPRIQPAWLVGLAVAAALALVTMLVLSRGVARDPGTKSAGASGSPPSPQAGVPDVPTVAQGAPPVTLRWPSKPPSEWTGSIVVRPALAMSGAVPHLAQPGGLLSGVSQRDAAAERARRATVMIQAGSRWGSGVVISADGWLLTSYRIVAAAAQRAALGGDLTYVDVFIAGGAGAGSGSDRKVRGTLYRADPERDLALVKLEPGAVRQSSFVPLGTTVGVGEKCLVVRALSDDFPWRLDAKVSREFHYPEHTSISARSIEASPSLVRWRTAMIETDAAVSDSELGAPLINAQGQLVGLTVPVGKGAGGQRMAWHVPVSELIAFIASPPASPENVPFDAWTAGLPEAALLEPAQIDRDQDGLVDTLRFVHAQTAPTRVAPVAVTLFLEAAGQPRGKEPASPGGLWAVPDGGSFHFDVFVTARADGVTASGYTNAEGIVDEIRTGGGVASAVIVWRRDANGRWSSSRPASATAVIDMSRFGDARAKKLRSLMSELLEAGEGGKRP